MVAGTKVIAQPNSNIKSNKFCPSCQSWLTNSNNNTEKLGGAVPEAGQIWGRRNTWGLRSQVALWKILQSIFKTRNSVSGAGKMPWMLWREGKGEEEIRIGTLQRSLLCNTRRHSNLKHCVAGKKTREQRVLDRVCPIWGGSWGPAWHQDENFPRPRFKLLKAWDWPHVVQVPRLNCVVLLRI